MAQGTSVGFLAATTFLGVPGFAELGEYFRVADEALLDMLRISKMGAEWDMEQRLKQFNGELRLRAYHAPVPIIQPVGWCLEPLDRTSVRSLVDWLRYGLERDELFPLESLSPADGVSYANYIEGGQPRTQAEFINDIRMRLPNSPRCDGYRDDGRVLQIWTSGWSPPLAMTALCYVDCWPVDPPWESQIAALLFYENDNNWTLRALWLNQPDEFSDASGQGLIGCDHTSAPSLQITPVTRQSLPSIATCPSALPSRLTVGEYAYVVPEPPVANRVRAGPGRDYPVVGKAQPGAIMEVLEGPRCANDWAWWKIRVLDTGLSGWTAEGNNQEYWLAPCSSRNSCPWP